MFNMKGCHRNMPRTENNSFDNENEFILQINKITRKSIGPYNFLHHDLCLICSVSSSLSLHVERYRRISVIENFIYNRLGRGWNVEPLTP